MKKLLILALFALAFSQKIFAASDPEVNSKAVANLEANFTDVNEVSWKVGDDFDKATFFLAKERVDVYYDVNGDMMGSFKTFAYNKLPKTALKTLSTQYTFPKYQVKDCMEFTDTDNNHTYYVSMENKGETIVLEISAFGSVSAMHLKK